MNKSEAITLKEHSCPKCGNKLSIQTRGLFSKKYILYCEGCKATWQEVEEFKATTNNKNKLIHLSEKNKENIFNRNKNTLIKGSCIVQKTVNERFIDVIQNNERFYLRFNQSSNSEYIVVWSMSINFREDKNKQICLVENSQILWCKTYELVEEAYVSNNGTVCLLIHNYVSGLDKNNKSGYYKKDTIYIINKNEDDVLLSFIINEEIMSLNMSPDGKFLIYNLQKYNPNNYNLVLYDINKKYVQWEYHYPQNQVIHELIFIDNLIHVYAGQRPSAYIDRKYVFSLDFNGNKTNSPPLNLTQKEPIKKEQANIKSKSDEVNILEKNGSVTLTNEVYMKTPFGVWDGTLTITNQKLTVQITNPLSGELRTLINVTPEKSLNIVFGGEDEVFIAPNENSPEESRLYLRYTEKKEIKRFTEEFNRFRKKGSRLWICLEKRIGSRLVSDFQHISKLDKYESFTIYEIDEETDIIMLKNSNDVYQSIDMLKFNPVIDFLYKKTGELVRLFSNPNPKLDPDTIENIIRKTDRSITESDYHDITIYISDILSICGAVEYGILKNPITLKNEVAIKMLQ